MLLRSVIIFCFINLYTIVIYAQEPITLTVKGKVLAEDSTLLTGYTIRVSQQNVFGLLQYYQHTSGNSFSFNLKPRNADSIIVYVSKTGFENLQQKFSILYLQQRNAVQFTLLKRTVNLDSVVVKQGKWKSGDTTFYNKEYYARGGEVKLKDIIDRIPDFTINDQGQLLYKHRLVSKIKIGNEEIFATETDLLLRSFPIHVLENIEVLENQGDNKVLNGIYKENKIIVNLSLNKKATKLVFGDMSVGAGTDARYTISPVLFSVQKQISLGAINNTNNTGEGSRVFYENRFQAIESRYSERKILLNNGISNIREIPQSYFIKNRFLENRFSLGFKMFGHIENKLELSMLTDRQEQAQRISTVIINGQNIVTRYQRSDKINDPKLWDIQYKTTLLAKSKQNLSFNLHAIRDAGTFFLNDSYAYNNLNETAINSLTNTLNTVTAQLNFTQRLSAGRAIATNIKLTKEMYRQRSVTISDQVRYFAPLSGSSFNQMNIDMGNSSSTLDIEQKYFFKLFKKKISTTFLFEKIQAHTTPVVSLSQTVLNNSDTIVNELSQKGFYASTKFSQKLSYPVKFFKMDASVTGEAGALQYRFEEPTNNFTATKPLLNLGLKQRRNLKAGVLDYEISFYQTASEVASVYNVVLPAGYNSFKAGLTQPASLQYLSYISSFSFSQKSLLRNISVGLFGRSNLNSISYSNDLRGIYIISRPVLVNKPTQQIQLFSTYVKHLKFIQSFLSVDMSATKSNQLYGKQENISYADFTRRAAKFTIERRFTKSYTLKANYKTEFQQSIFRITDFKQYLRRQTFTMEQEFRISKILYIKTNSAYLVTSTSSSKQAPVLITDILAKFSPSKSKLTFIADGNNLFNIRSISSFSNGLIQKDVQEIIVQKRYVLFKALFQF